MEKIEDIGGATNVCSENITAEQTETGQNTVHLSAKSYCYTWTINDFSECLKYRNCQFSSPIFIFENTEWRLRLWVITEKSKVRNFKILLQNVSKIDSDLYFNNNISVVDDDGKNLQAEVEFCSEVPSSPLYLIPPSGCATFHSNKLIVRSEFSSLKSKMCNQKEASPSKTDQSNSSHSQCYADNAPLVSSPPKRRTRRSESSRTRSTVYDEYLTELRLLLTPIFFIVCISMVLIALFDLNHKMQMNNQDLDLVPTINSKEINNLIFDSTKKLSLIAEALNLTSVKEKSLEILAIYSKMYNYTDHIQPVMQTFDSNITQNLASKIGSFVASEVKQFILGINNDTEKSL